MKTGGVALVCGLVLLVASQARTDELDDLLAGMPVVTAENPSVPVSTPSREATLAADEATLVQQGLQERSSASPSVTLAGSRPSEATPWQVAPTPAPKPTAAPPHDRKALPPASVSLVPEPSAIALAVLAMLYFLIFFRRRHLA